MMDIDPRKVLVCVSPGEDCAASIDLAAEEARRRGCGVHLALAIGPMWVGPTGGTDFHLIEGEWRRVGETFLHECAQQLRRLLGDGATVSTEITHGPVAGALVGVSENASLVVLQHHRMGRTHAVPTLSVTNGVAARAYAPVVAVPDTWREQTAPSDLVAAGVEDRVCSTQVVRHAFELAQLCGGSVRLVQAWAYAAAFDADFVHSDVGEAVSTSLRDQVLHDFSHVYEEPYLQRSRSQWGVVQEARSEVATLTQVAPRQRGRSGVARALTCANTRIGSCWGPDWRGHACASWRCVPLDEGRGPLPRTVVAVAVAAFGGRLRRGVKMQRPGPSDEAGSVALEGAPSLELVAVECRRGWTEVGEGRGASFRCGSGGRASAHEGAVGWAGRVSIGPQLRRRVPEAVVRCP